MMGDFYFSVEIDEAWTETDDFFLQFCKILYEMEMVVLGKFCEEIGGSWT